MSKSISIFRVSFVLQLIKQVSRKSRGSVFGNIWRGRQLAEVKGMPRGISVEVDKCVPGGPDGLIDQSVRIHVYLHVCGNVYIYIMYTRMCV